LQENIRRNFGMPQPNGYRKAMRFMRHANKFGLPIVTFVDTPGAYAGKTAEELGQVTTEAAGTQQHEHSSTHSTAARAEAACTQQHQF
jgi:acetyl-CoA carboxylase alpha subunit